MSKILINDSADLLALIQSAERIRRQAELLTIFRTLVSASITLGWYILALDCAQSTEITEVAAFRILRELCYTSHGHRLRFFESLKA